MPFMSQAKQQSDCGLLPSSQSRAAQRLAALHATGLLDAPVNERFDRLTRLARRLARTPVALVSLIDAERQFFLSSEGLAEPWASLRAMPLSHSFCRMVVEAELPLSVEDARRDPRLHGHPAIEAIGVVSYLGVPLALPDGRVIGALCVIDDVPRGWTAEDGHALTDLAGAAMTELAAGLQLREIEVASVALHKSEARYRALIEALGVAVYTTDADGRLTFHNEAAVALWGWRPPLGDTRWCGSWRLYTSDGAPMRHDECPMATALRDNRPVCGGEVVAERPDGTRVPFIAYPAPLRDAAGAPIGGVNVLVDITKRKVAEAALCKSEAFLRSVLEASTDCIKVVERDGTLSFMNGSGQCAMEIEDFCEVEGKEWATLWPAETREQIRAAVAEALAGCPARFEAFSPTAKGTPRWWDVSVAPFPDLDGRPARVVAISRDITKRKRTEAALRESEARLRETQTELLHVSRVSAVGEMASALAHELNQPLTAVTSAVRATQRMLASLPGGVNVVAGVGEAMDLAAEQALRAGQIVRHLRNFVARDGEADKKLEDLAKLVEDSGTLALVGASVSSINVDLLLDPRLPPVLVNRIQIQQVLLNLMRNALEALTQKAAEEDEAPLRREIKVTAARSGPEMVEVAVADTGPGLAPEIAGRLFKAFVSTKPGGMGMGLSICRSIVEAHGGRLWVELNPGGGAVFRFTLLSPPQAVAS
jgi:PAS domain S-box-containing protein